MRFKLKSHSAVKKQWPVPSCIERSEAFFGKSGKNQFVKGDNHGHPHFPRSLQFQFSRSAVVLGRNVTFEHDVFLCFTCLQT